MRVPPTITNYALHITNCFYFLVYFENSICFLIFTYEIKNGEFGIGENFGDVDANPYVYCIKKEMRFKTTSL